MPTKLTQHELRKIAIQFLYSYSVRPDQAEDELSKFILEDKFLSENNKKYLDAMIDGVRTNQNELDAEISKYLISTWSMDRLTSIDRAILELASYEIIYSDLPPVIAVNEAVNLTKDFSDEAASKLVNGILTHLIPKDEK
ncbi:transcription antitermination factor NusB [Lactovum miscens]|uniref:Transcription antitermination protein NusB n=1 Tax=Lactovum miscens TaxID=190387 RepID=A0A841C7X5_9LACT|nr:transcription antitermination factor NusB [Lactovum miscens]MBB5887499.1 N utilization substance protein B [Lactovum miscens]